MTVRAGQLGRPLFLSMYRSLFSSLSFAPSFPLSLCLCLYLSLPPSLSPSIFLSLSLDLSLYPSLSLSRCHVLAALLSRCCQTYERACMLRIPCSRSVAWLRCLSPALSLALYLALFSSRGCVASLFLSLSFLPPPRARCRLLSRRCRTYKHSFPLHLPCSCSVARRRRVLCSRSCLGRDLYSSKAQLSACSPASVAVRTSGCRASWGGGVTFKLRDWFGGGGPAVDGSLSSLTLHEGGSPRSRLLLGSPHSRSWLARLRRGGAQLAIKKAPRLTRGRSVRFVSE